jgi:hypothetical protein
MTKVPPPLTSSVHKKGKSGGRGERESSILMSLEEPELAGKKFSSIGINKPHIMGSRGMSCFLHVAFGFCGIWCI